MIKNKLKNNEGSSMVLVIIAMVLVTMLIGTIGMQLNNQIKFNSKTEKYIQSKYESQGGIERGIAEFINKVNVTGDLNSNTSSISDKYMDIVLQYSNEALYINGNQGGVEQEINAIISEIKSLKESNLPLDKIKEKYNVIDGQINTAIDRLGKNDNNVEKKLVYDELLNAKEYLRILQIDMTTENSVSNIKYIIDRITSNAEFCKRDIKPNWKILNSDIQNHLQDLINRVDVIDQNIGSKGQYTEFIRYTYEFDERIQAIINEMTIEKESMLVSNIKGYYQNGNANNNGNGNSNANKDFYEIVYNRMNTIKLELELLRENILFLKDGITSGGNSSGSGSSNGSNSNNKLVVTIPKTIDNIMEEELDYKSKVTVDECKSNNSISIKSLDDKYEVEVIATDAIIEIGLSIESENDNYTTNSKVNIIISNIKDSETYDVKYEVVSWN